MLGCSKGGNFGASGKEVAQAAVLAGDQLMIVSINLQVAALFVFIVDVYAYLYTCENALI